MKLSGGCPSFFSRDSGQNQNLKTIGGDVPRTLYRKLVESHTVARLDAEHVLLYADLHIMNE